MAKPHSFDLMMPVMDGHEFLRILRNYVGLSTIPVMVVSRRAGELDASEQQMIVASLQTPYAHAELLRVVNAHVAR